MPHQETISKLAEANGGVFRASDLAALGCNTCAIRKRVNENVIEGLKAIRSCVADTAKNMPKLLEYIAFFLR